MTYPPPSSSGPSSQPYPGVPYHGGPPPAAAPSGPRRSWLGLALGGLVVVLVLCCGGGAALMYVFRGEFAVAEEPAGDAPPSADPLRPTRPSPSAPTPSATPATQNLKPGQTLVVVDEDGDELQVTVRAPRTNKGCSEFAKPRSGGYLVLDVTVRVSRGTGDISPFAFNFLSPDSTTTEVAGGRVTECGKDLDNARNLPAGTKRTGQLVFDVKPARGQVVFKGAGNEIAGTWKIG